MIQAPTDKGTEALAGGVPVKGVPADVLKCAVNKSLQLDTATRLDDLRVPPGDYLETLFRDRCGQHAIRANDH